MWDIRDKVVLITGATSGIGKVTARELVRAGARVIIHGRDALKTERAAKEISEGNKIDYILGDLSSLADVKKMAGDFKSRYKSLDVLINNAGGVFVDETTSRDQIEMTFAVNYLSHYLLTRLLLGLLEKPVSSRVIHVSSNAHRFIRDIDLNRVGLPAGYKGFNAYSAAKVCLTLFAYELSERLKGTGVTSNALHPGVVKTGFGRNNKNIFMKAVMPVFSLMGISPDKGALTSIYLASSDEVEGVNGKYFDQCKPVSSTAITYNKEYQKRLWELSEKLVKSYL